MNSKITVIVPIYNVEAYLEKCFQSLQRQTFKNFEVWAVDDGSPDNSKKIIEKWCQIDNRFKLIQKKNGGYGSVLELSINKITTKYFLICDPDDWLEKNALQELYIFAENNNLDIAVGDKYNIYSRKENVEEKIYNKTFKKNSITPKKVYTLSKDVQKFSLGDPSPHAKLYKTRVAKNIKFPQKVSYTDFVLYILSLANTQRIAYYNVALADYLIERKGNTRTDIRKSIINDYSICWNSIFDQLDKKNNDILLYRLYFQLEYILSEYNRVINSNLNDKYGKKIVKLFLKLQPYKKNIQPYISSIGKKFLFEGLMHKSTCTFFAKLYCTYKKS